MSIREKLRSIKVLFRAPEHLGLYGIPYEMRPGQSPGNLWDSTRIQDTLKQAAGWHGATLVTPGPREDWVFLGYPGWWGHVSRDEQREIEAFLEPLEKADLIPGGPYEWSQIDRPLPGGLEPNQRTRRHYRASTLHGPAMETTFGKDIDPDRRSVADLDRAMDRYETFHAKRPHRAVELAHELPTSLVAVGEAQSTMYRTDKWHKDGTDEDYKHVHDKGENKRYEFGSGVVVYEPSREVSKSKVNGKLVGNRHAVSVARVVTGHALRAATALSGTVRFPVARPKALTMLGYCLGFFVRRYDDEEVYEVNPRGCYLFCSPSGNMLAVYSPEEQPDGSRGFLAVMAGGNLRVLKDGIDG